MASHEISPGILTTRGAFAVGNSLLVKRYSNGRDDNIHIMQVNKGKGSSFKIPSVFIPVFAKRLNEILEQILLSSDEDIIKIPGLETVCTYDDLTKKEFWEHNSAVRISNFYVRPYRTTNNINLFRLWSEVCSENKIYCATDKENVLGVGPATSLSLKDTQVLVTALERLGHCPRN